MQNTKELRATASEIAAPKPDLSAKAEKKRFRNTFSKDRLKGKSPVPKLRKPAHKSLSQPLMQPHQYDLRCPAAKDKNIAPSNLDALTQPLQCDLQTLQNTTELRSRTSTKRCLNWQLHCAADLTMLRA